MRRQAQLGFGLGLGGSFSDTAVTLAIIGILGYVAYSAYGDYRALARVSEAIRSAEDARTAIEKTFAKNPADMSHLVSWVPRLTEHLSSAAITREGSIVLRFAESVAPPGQNEVHIVPVSGGKAVDLSAPASAGLRFEWQCGGPAGKTTLPEKHRPKDCR